MELRISKHGEIKYLGIPREKSNYKEKYFSMQMSRSSSFVLTVFYICIDLKFDLFHVSPRKDCKLIPLSTRTTIH